MTLRCHSRTLAQATGLGARGRLGTAWGEASSLRHVRRELWSRPWEHAFATAQGSALTRYRRALERRHIFGAEIAVREMSYISPRDALGLLALYACALNGSAVLGYAV